ncbi:PREDICTED: endosomal/lysomomal potassium channel TMEM175-like [Priapulus caudatus]|uniref:Endosomal/lysosomal proton channel TMEM175 n=1 Tax=Priapulus caudatus TaxID=37621 RepID=A0ABM1E014_PRICU|nr:PREDICTED: endosomal/lysomomal potassium channel TMEM175-like [Priapulus caudatus]
MILPTMHAEVRADENLYDSFPTLLRRCSCTRCAFLTVVQVWASHARMLDLVAHADDLVVLLNLAQMMAVTFLPFAFTLLARFSADMFAVILYAGLFAVVDLLQMALVWHAFRSPRLLKRDVREHAFRELIASALYWSSGTQLLLCVLAIALAVATPTAALVLLVRALTTSFADAICAIVATLVILDISERDVPTADEVAAAGGLLPALADAAPVFVAYAGTFITVATLWFLHHSLLAGVRCVDDAMLMFNTLSLFAIGLLPLGFKLAGEFVMRPRGDDAPVSPRDVRLTNEMIAIQMNCACVFLGATFMACVWIAALCRQGEQLLEPEIAFGGRSHGHLAAKLVVYPVVTLAVFFVSLQRGAVTIALFFGMQLAVPLVFLGMKIFAMFLEYRTRGMSVDRSEFDASMSSAAGIL